MAAPSTATPSRLEAQLTGKAKQLEDEHSKSLSEAERLREEVNRTRAMRASRAAGRSQKSISGMAEVASPPFLSPSIEATAPATSETSTVGTFRAKETVKHSASSFPVYAGRLNSVSSTASGVSSKGSGSSSNGTGTSLANFIGGDIRVKGPLLNKARPAAEEELLSHQERTSPQATFLSRNPALLPGRSSSPGVALPGMTRSSAASGGTAASSSAATTSISPKPSLSTSGTATSTSPTNSFQASTSKSPSLGAVGGSSPTSGIYNRNSSKSPIPMEGLSLQEAASTTGLAPDANSKEAINDVPPRTIPVHTFGSSSLPGKLDASAQALPTSASEVQDIDATPSLTRLKGSNLVKQRLQWGEAQSSPTGPSGFGSANPSARSSPISSPKPSPSIDTAKGGGTTSGYTPSVQSKRSSVLDRWGRDTPDQSPRKASPQASPKAEAPMSKWPKPAYSKPVVSPQSAADPSQSSIKATASPVEPSNTTSLPVTSTELSAPAEAASASTDTIAAESSARTIDKSEPSAFQRPVTKPPWMTQGNGKPDPPPNQNVEPERAASYPKPSYSTQPTSPGPRTAPKPSKSLPPGGLPISVSPAPYMRSHASPSASSPRSGTFQSSASSFPVSLGVAPTHARPLSLAHFIGGDKKIAGPVLNKVRPEESDGYGLETDASGGPGKVGSFLTRNPGVMDEMMKKQKVPMPGMVRAQSPQVAESQPMEKRSSTSPLPLPGMESPKLPLPGDLSKSPPLDTAGDALSSPVDQPSESYLASPEARLSASTLYPESQKHDDTLKKVSEERDRNDNADASSSPNLGATPISSVHAAIPTEYHRNTPSWEGTLKTLEKGPARHAPKPPSRENSKDSRNTSGRSIRRFSRRAVRQVNIRSLDVSHLSSAPFSNTSKHYVSVDVLSITDDAKPVTLSNAEQSVFYSTEMLIIVLRSKQGGLIETELTAWRGKHCSEDGQERLAELESRYRAKATRVDQGRESLQLVKALGGRLVTRQGFRSTFDILNTTFYRVRSEATGVSFIDEVELQAASLCSGFSYIASVFQDLFVWYGRGSPDSECRVALQYAEELARSSHGSKRKVAHMLEGSESQLWQDIMGGDEEYASANHWRFRLGGQTALPSATQFYHVEEGQFGKVTALGNETAAILNGDSLYIIRTPCEAYILVSPSKRGDTQHIAMALKTAQALIKAQFTGARSSSPYRPNLHALILPSLIPKDLQAMLRSNILDDMNSPYHPTTMNVIDQDTAWSHLEQTEFFVNDILDEALLPLGVAPELLPSN